MSETGVLKRVRRKIKSSANPMFESWLKEWQDEAKKSGSEMHYCFGRALKSLQKYPFRLETGKECFILENFGAKICMMLDKKLNDCRGYRNTVDDQSPILGNDLAQKRKSSMDSPVRILKHAKDDSGPKQSKHNKKSDRGVYLPGFRSGGYAILLTLYRTSNQMTKAELEVEAQKLCDAPFKKSGNSHYTAWSSMSTLIKKGLVEKSGRPIRYFLTTEGMSTAVQLESSENVNNITNSCASNKSSTNEKYPDFNVSISIHSSFEGPSSCNTNKEKKSVQNKSKTDLPKVRNEKKSNHLDAIGGRSNSAEVDAAGKDQTFFLLPNEFDVILFVDNKEMENKKNMEGDKIVKYLRRRNVKFEVKNLSVGDYIWVCRDRQTNRELVLPYIVERKRFDDLAGSVKDGRFHEQKFRMKNCGLQHCIYLVEKYGNDSTRLGLPLPTIQQAVSNTKVVDGFYVKITNNNNESLAYLSLMTEFLTNIVKGKTLVSCSKANLPVFSLSDEVTSLLTFPEFNKESGKMRKFTVRNMLVKHLLQLNGVSVERAKAIVKHFPTPKLLIEALQDSDSESIIADIKFGALGRSVGISLAKTLQQLYTLPRLS